MAKEYDAIIIGAGHNGLVTAAYLAKAGLDVLVLERRHVVGGSAVSEQVFPGFTFSVCSYVVSLFRPEIIRDLELPRHGLEILPMDCSFTPTREGTGLARWGDPEETRKELARFSHRDSEVYPEFSRTMGEMARIVKPILTMTPPDISRPDLEAVKSLLGIGKRIASLGEDLIYVKAQMMTMSALEFLDQWFETDVLKATMSVSGIIGTFQSVSSPGTAYVLLHHYMGEIDGAFRSWGFSKGGTGALSESIASAARSHGAEIRLSSGIQKVLLSGDRATGVVLQNGDEIKGKIVVSGCDPRLSTLGFIGEENLDDDFVAMIKRYKFRGSSGKLNLALDAPPNFKCRPGDGPHIRGDVAIAPSVEYLERAYDDAKYGEFSKRPYLNIVIPTLTDPTLAPPGKHILSAFVQYAPYNLKNGTWDERKEEFGETIIDTIAEFAPNIRDIILHKQVLTPLDLEREFGLTEGNIFHGELSLEQLFVMRPVPGYARYRTPIRDYYLCGSGTHPGGGIMGAPGYIAAREILKDIEQGKVRIQ